MEDIILHQGDIPKDLCLGNVVAIDTETMGLFLPRDRLCLLQIKGNKDNKIHLVKFNKDYLAPNLKTLLSDKNIVKIFHYARFDLLAIYLYLGVRCDNVFCTKIASKLVRTNTNKHSLKELLKEFLSIDLKKQEQCSNWGAEILTEQQQIYAADDVRYLHQIRDYLLELLEKEDRKEIAFDCFNFLRTKIILDYLGWSEQSDIFNH